MPNRRTGEAGSQTIGRQCLTKPRGAGLIAGTLKTKTAMLLALVEAKESGPPKAHPPRVA
jgi:hypothetical protein